MTMSLKILATTFAVVTATAAGTALTSGTETEPPAVPAAKDTAAARTAAVARKGESVQGSVTDGSPKELWTHRRTAIEASLAASPSPLAHDAEGDAPLAKRQAMLGEVAALVQGCGEFIDEGHTQTVVTAHVIGTPEDGTLVENVSLSVASENPELDECLTESAYTLDLGPTDVPIEEDLLLSLGWHAGGLAELPTAKMPEHIREAFAQTEYDPVALENETIVFGLDGHGTTLLSDLTAAERFETPSADRRAHLRRIGSMTRPSSPCLWLISLCAWVGVTGGCFSEPASAAEAREPEAEGTSTSGATSPSEPTATDAETETSQEPTSSGTTALDPSAATSSLGTSDVNGQPRARAKAVPPVTHDARARPTAATRAIDAAPMSRASAAPTSPRRTTTPTRPRTTVPASVTQAAEPSRISRASRPMRARVATTSGSHSPRAHRPGS